MSSIKERPILFSAPMVRAILDGSKTQIRRILKPQPEPYLVINRSGEEFHCCCVGPTEYTEGYGQKGGPWWMYGRPWGCAPHMDLPLPRCPYGNPGDRLWVRETWSHTGTGVWTIDDARYRRVDGNVVYRSTDPEPCPGCWWPSIHMPREFSRITLEVVSVRVERLRDISEEDAKAEGIECTHQGDHTYWKNYRFKTAHPKKGTTITDEEHRAHAFRDLIGGTVTPATIGAVRSYQSLWESINGAGSWEENPFVWVVEFKDVGGKAA